MGAVAGMCPSFASCNAEEHNRIHPTKYQSIPATHSTCTSATNTHQPLPCPCVHAGGTRCPSVAVRNTPMFDPGQCSAHKKYHAPDSPLLWVISFPDRKQNTNTPFDLRGILLASKGTASRSRKLTIHVAPRRNATPAHQKCQGAKL